MANKPNEPIVNYPSLYIDGLNLSWLSLNKLILSAGKARDSSNTNDIVLSNPLTIDASVVGVNGLDEGVFTENTCYAVYIIADQNLYNSPQAILSQNLLAPLLPPGYEISRRVGYVLTTPDVAPNVQFWEFTQTGKSNDRNYYLLNQITRSVIGVTSPTMATFNINLINLMVVPPVEKLQAYIYVKVTNVLAAGKGISLRPEPASSNNAVVAPFILGVSGAGRIVTTNVWLPYKFSDGNATMQHASTAPGFSLDLTYKGYSDTL